MNKLIPAFLIFAGGTAFAKEMVFPVVTGTTKDRAFSTTVQVANPSATDVACSFSYVGPERLGNPLVSNETIPAGKTVVYEDFLSEVAAAGTVRVKCSSEVELVARVQDSLDGGKTFRDGRTYRPFVLANLLGLNESRTVKTTVDLVLVEVAGKPLHVEVQAQNVAGVVLAKKAYDIPPYAQRVVNFDAVREKLPELDVVISVPSGEGRIVIGTETRDSSLVSVARRHSASRAEVGRNESADQSRAILNQLVVSPFKAAPFRDPATGLDFMRDRWYDPSTGTFITPDRAGYRDSSNLYTFGGGDPVNKSDPTGMYQADVHAGLTYKLATLAGFNAAEAELIAKSNVGVDLDPATNPVHNAAIGNWTPVFYYHFPIDAGAKIVTPGNLTAQGFMASATTLSSFGRALHTFQDSYSHSNAYYGNIYGQATTDVGRRTISVAERTGNLKDPAHGIMHETFRQPTGVLDAREAAREADYTYVRPDFAWKAAQATLEQMLIFRALQAFEWAPCNECG